MALPVSWRLMFPQVSPFTGFGEPGCVELPRENLTQRGGGAEDVREV